MLNNDNYEENIRIIIYKAQLQEKTFQFTNILQENNTIISKLEQEKTTVISKLEQEKNTIISKLEQEIMYYQQNNKQNNQQNNQSDINIEQLIKSLQEKDNKVEVLEKELMGSKNTITKLIDILHRNNK